MKVSGTSTFSPCVRQPGLVGTVLVSLTTFLLLCLPLTQRTVARAANDSDPRKEDTSEVETVAVHMIGEPNAILPIRASTVPDTKVTSLIGDRCAVRDTRSMELLVHPESNPCSNLTISDDGTTYRFTIRRGALWHDGEELTAEDFAMNCRLLRSPELSPRLVGELPDEVARLEVQDSHTFSVRLTKPLASGLARVKSHPVPAHAIN